MAKTWQESKFFNYTKPETTPEDREKALRAEVILRSFAFVQDQEVGDQFALEFNRDGWNYRIQFWIRGNGDG